MNSLLLPPSQSVSPADTTTILKLIFIVIQLTSDPAEEDRPDKRKIPKVLWVSSGNTPWLRKAFTEIVETMTAMHGKESSSTEPRAQKLQIRQRKKHVLPEEILLQGKEAS